MLNVAMPSSLTACEFSVELVRISLRSESAQRLDFVTGKTFPSAMTVLTWRIAASRKNSATLHVVIRPFRTAPHRLELLPVHVCT